MTEWARKSESLRVLQVVGPSNAGKTTLVERLVERLADDDRRVATVKAIHHDIEPDTPGRDTHRHRTAGADAAVGVTPSLSFRITRGGKGDDDVAALESTLAGLERDGYDIAVVEGFSAAGLPAVVLGRDESNSADRLEGHDRIVASAPTADDVDVDAVLAYLTRR